MSASWSICSGVSRSINRCRTSLAWQGTASLSAERPLAVITAYMPREPCRSRYSSRLGVGGRGLELRALDRVPSPHEHVAVVLGDDRGMPGRAVNAGPAA